jgi:hypothetical protein
MTSNTSTMNGRRLGTALAGLMMLVAGTTLATPAQAADGFYPMLCRGPLPAMRAADGILHMRARPGRRANAPRPGECVWRDRGIDRPGEVAPDGFIHIRLRAPRLRVAVASVDGHIRESVTGNVLAVSFWRTNNLGYGFTFEARRVNNRGGYVARALRRPARHAASRATPAPGYHRPTVTAEPAPPAPRRSGVYARPAP